MQALQPRAGGRDELRQAPAEPAVVHADAPVLPGRCHPPADRGERGALDRALVASEEEEEAPREIALADLPDPGLERAGRDDPAAVAAEARGAEERRVAVEHL